MRKRIEGDIAINGRKEVLLKAIIQSIPMYVMAVFKIPKKLCKEINGAMAES